MTTYRNPNTAQTHQTFDSETGRFDDGCQSNDAEYTTTELLRLGWTADAPTLTPDEALTPEEQADLEPTPRPFAVGDRVTVDPHGPVSANNYNRRHAIAGETPVPAVITQIYDNYADVRYDDGTPGTPLMRTMRHADTETTPQEATEAPQSDVDPLEAWEAGLADSDAVRAEIWQAADEGADAANACGEYERTVAWPNGHEGREHMLDEDDEPMGEGTITFRRTITATQEITVEVENGQDPWDALSDAYAEWETIDEREDDYGAEVWDTDRESREPDLGDAPTLAALIRAALESETPYRQIRDAILATAQRHGAPLTQQSVASIAAEVSEHRDGAWQAPQHRRIDRQPVSNLAAQRLADRRSVSAYDYAQEMLASESGNATRIAWGTLATVLATEWEVRA